MKAEAGTLAAVAAALLMLLPAPARGQAEAPSGSFLGGYALLAHDPSTGQTGVVLASSSYSAGSGHPWLETGTGAAAVLGGGPARAGRAALEALRSGAAAATALSTARSAGGASGAPMAVIDEECGRAADTGGAPFRWSGTARGEAGGLCYVAVGSLLPDARFLRRAVGAFSDSSGTMLERMYAFLQAADRAAGELTVSRSAALWIDAPEPSRGALGRARLRLQVEDVQRPGDALGVVIEAGRADALARRAAEAVDGGAFGRAIELADRALEIDPANAVAWLARGRALVFQGDDEAGERAFQRMLEVNPYLLHVLGDPATGAEDRAPSVRAGMIPYRPLLLRRLDVYRRAFYRGDVDFPEEGEPRP